MMRDQRDEFDVVLDDVLREVANPEPVEDLKHRVMLQMEMAAQEEAELGKAATHDPGFASFGFASFGGGQKQSGLVGSLWNNLREAVWPTKLPPLELESQPIAIVDRMAAGRSYRSMAWAVAAHAVALLLIGLLVKSHIRFAAPVKITRLAALAAPLKALPKIHTMGGGGGQRGPTPVTKGTPPKFSETQIVPPKAPPQMEAKIHIEPTIEVQKDVKMESSIPQVGVASSPLVGMSMGNGAGTGLGAGSGAGLGAGSGGNTGGGPKRIGGGVSAPILVYGVEPEFSEQARKAKLAGNVLVNIWVDEKGNPTHCRVLRGLGLGLDEKAMEAVKQYRFRPALENGKPVMVEMNVLVQFHIF